MLCRHAVFLLLLVAAKAEGSSNWFRFWPFRDQCVPAIPQTDEPSNYLLIGNPGVGKSTILNGLVCKSWFKSGVSFGGGMTYQLDKQEDGHHTFLDTPGLADPELRKAAAAAISNALRQGGHFKIFFVITLEGGRVRPADVTTMKLVLDAASITSYGIIINKVGVEIKRELEENPQKRQPAPFEKVMASILQTLPKNKRSLAAHVMAHDSRLDGADDAVKALPGDLVRFVRSLSGITIDPGNVKEVRENEFEEVQEQMQAAIRKVEAENKNLAKALDLSQEEKRQMQQAISQQSAKMQDLVSENRQIATRMWEQAQEADIVRDTALIGSGVSFGVVGLLAFLR